MVRASGRPMSAHSRNRAPDAGGADTTARSNPRSCEERPAPKRDLNRSWASDHAFCASRKRLSPALVSRSSFERRSDPVVSTAMRPSRSSGMMLRESVVRSITISSASALMVDVPFRFSFARIENWLVRKPVDAKH